MRQFSLCLAVAIGLAASDVSAVMLSIEAADNATVQPGGPRSGGSGKAFFNVEGSANGNFASYGVADFNYGTIPTVTAIISASIQLTQSNAGFTTDGPVVISLDTSATLADIQPGGTSPLIFDGTDPGTDQDVADGDIALDPFSGTFNFVEGMDGDVDAYTLGLSASLEAELLSRLNAGDTIRLVIGTGSDTVAATWAGATNDTFDGPTLVLDVDQIPEPTTLALAALALAALIVTRRG